MKTHITIIRRQSSDITTESVASNRRIRICYEYIDSYEFNNLDEKDKFFERYKLPNLTQEEVGQQDNSMLIKSMEFVAKSLPTKKMPGPDSFTGKFLLPFKEDIMLILYNCFQKIEEEEKFSTHWETGITYQSQVKILQENCGWLSIRNIDTNILNIILAN